ncbi:phosphatidate cytidylyltransferase [Aurantimonas sp. A2-1-M11]|uniref:phosphatidate cytidylyltransferase n=1 Tax=Aurantimonas sp. A2-1-M11 TaxID=3113712 RepID=UPI002F91C18F
MGLEIRRFFVAGSWSDLRSRVISALILGLIVIVLTAIGGWPFRVLCALTGIIVFDEWARMTRAKRIRPIYDFARGALIVAAVALVFSLGLLAIAVIVAAMLFIAATDRDERSARWVHWGLFYAGAAALAPGMLRGSDEAGLATLGFIIVVVWSTDIFAYFTGRTFGGPKLLPAVSPKKTWSGAAGGLLAGTILGAVYAHFVSGDVGVFIIVLAAVLSVVGQAGDLFESWIKRRFGVKDSGRLIPGHGGLMDRIDALIVAMAVTWVVGLAIAGFDEPARGIFAL